MPQVIRPFGNEILKSSPQLGDAAFYDPETTLFRNQRVDAFSQPRPGFQRFDWEEIAVPVAVPPAVNIHDLGVPDGYKLWCHNHASSSTPGGHNNSAAGISVGTAFRRSGNDITLRPYANLSSGSGVSINNANVSAGLIFKPSDRLISSVSASPGLNLFVSGYLVPDSGPVRLISEIIDPGGQIMYTCPEGKKAYFAGPSSFPNWLVGAFAEDNVTAVSPFGVYRVPSGGSADNTNMLRQHTTMFHQLVLTMYGRINAGDQIVVNVATRALVWFAVEEEDE